MPLSWNEIKARALAFSREWKGEGSSAPRRRASGTRFFDVFGVERRRVAIFEKQVDITRAGQHLKARPHRLLLEGRAAGRAQERRPGPRPRLRAGGRLLRRPAGPRPAPLYPGLRLRALPPATTSKPTPTIEFPLADLHRNVQPLRLHRRLSRRRSRAAGPRQHQGGRADGQAARPAQGAAATPATRSKLLLVRVLFCLFADDTGIFEPARLFRLWLDERTAADGSDLGPPLAQLFQVLNQPERTRGRKRWTSRLRAFPYVNGKLFDETLPIAVVRRADARGPARLLRARLERDLARDLRRAVPVDHGREGAAQPRRALHDRGEHPQAHQAAVPRRPVGRVRAGQGQPQQAVRVPQEAARR